MVQMALVPFYFELESLSFELESLSFKLVCFNLSRDVSSQIY